MRSRRFTILLALPLLIGGCTGLSKSESAALSKSLEPWVDELTVRFAVTGFMLSEGRVPTNREELERGAVVSRQWGTTLNLDRFDWVVLDLGQGGDLHIWWSRRGDNLESNYGEMILELRTTDSDLSATPDPCPKRATAISRVRRDANIQQTRP